MKQHYYSNMAEAVVMNQVEVLFTRIAVALESIVAAQRLSKPIPAIFNGNSDAHNVDFFFNQFEAYATSLYGNDTSVYLQILPNFLEGEPREIALAYGPSAEYGTVKQRIISEQNRRKSLGTNALTEFLAMQRRPGESLVVLSIRLETAVNRITHLDQNGKKVILHSKLMSLLHPEVAKRMNVHFCDKADVAMSDIINLGLQLENIFMEDIPAPPLQAPPLPANSIQAIASVYSPSEHKPCVPDSIVNNQKYQSPITRQTDVPCASRSIQSVSIPVHSLNQQSPSYYAKYKCHRCHKYGHIRKLCNFQKPQSKAKLLATRRHLHANVESTFSNSQSVSNVPKNFYDIAEVTKKLVPDDESIPIKSQNVLPCSLSLADGYYKNVFSELNAFPNMKEISKSPFMSEQPKVKEYSNSNVSNAKLNSKSSKLFSKIPYELPFSQADMKIGTITPM